MYLALAGTAAFERTSCFSVSSIIYLLKNYVLGIGTTQTHNDGPRADEIGTEFKEAYKCELPSLTALFKDATACWF